MRHLKNFNNSKTFPKNGDYIKANFYGFGDGTKDRLWEKYLNGEIGQIKREIKNSNLDAPKEYIANYNVSDYIYNVAFNAKERRYIKKDGEQKYIEMLVPLKDIIAFSKNKEDIEVILSANKYNI